MNKSESKYLNTARLMDEALLLLLEKKDFEYITVTEICKKAGVNRSTFYLHYETTADLLSESLEYIFGNLQDRYSSHKFFDATKGGDDGLLLFTPQYSVPYLEFLKEHRKLFMAALAQQETFKVEKTFNSLYEKLFYHILQKFGVPDGEKKYLLSYHMNGIHAVMIEWLKGGCKEEIPFIADLIVRLVNHKNAHENKGQN